eukprot:TRINITY_DN14_c0_g1_i4.p1 TRINITY_DN14_c0_g1~~TRINITY_DN14_c0_g1_i4.p1  ORF type:complete len:119 (-),score=46.20 TRINITY_DN14_c0_g1_i4:81-437(-)
MFFFFLMIRRPPRSTQSRSSAASDVYKRQVSTQSTGPLTAQDRCGRRIAAAHKIAGGFVANKHTRSRRDVEIKPVPSAQVLGGSKKKKKKKKKKHTLGLQLNSYTYQLKPPVAGQPHS